MQNKLFLILTLFIMIIIFINISWVNTAELKGSFTIIEDKITGDIITDNKITGNSIFSLPSIKGGFTIDNDQTNTPSNTGSGGSGGGGGGTQSSINEDNKSQDSNFEEETNPESNDNIIYTEIPFTENIDSINILNKIKKIIYKNKIVTYLIIGISLLGAFSIYFRKIIIKRNKNLKKIKRNKKVRKVKKN